MASITSMTFDQAAYSPGATVTLTVDYVPDSPSVLPTVDTATTVITDSAGTQVANSAAPFTVNEPQPAGDTLSTTDTGSRTWAEASDNGSVAVFTTTA